MPFTTTVTTTDPDIKVVLLNGRMHLGNQLREFEDWAKQITTQGCRKLILNMAGIEMMDSAALGTLFVVIGDMRQAGGQAHIAAATQRVMDVFKLAHADKVLSLHPDVASAIQACG